MIILPIGRVEFAEYKSSISRDSVTSKMHVSISKASECQYFNIKSAHLETHTCVEVDRIQEEVEGSGSAAEVRAPPPVIILGTEVEVAEEDGSFSTCDHQDQKYDEEEPKHVVNLVSPERWTWDVS